MRSESQVNRRSFLKTTVVGLGAAAAAQFDLNGAPGDGRSPEICFFEKPLTFLDHNSLAEFGAEIGYSGVEVAVRPGGRVEPERVEEDLPKLSEALKKRGLRVTILTSGINSVDQPHTEKVLRTAARLGIERYRMLWYRYDLGKPILPQLEALKPVLRDLVQMNRDLGISGLYQNHAGAQMVGASIWDIFTLIKDYDPGHLGLAYDLRHSQVEAGTCWPTQFHLAKSHVQAVCAKDFTWNTPGAPGAALGRGRVDRKVIPMLKKSGFTGPYSVHVEYLEGKPGLEECEKAFREDLGTLKDWLKA